MKKIITLGIIIACSVSLWAQQNSPAFWVVETNVKNRSYSIIRFYNGMNEQIHEVKLEGVYVDIRKPRYRRKLDKMLKDYNPESHPLAKRNKSRKSI
ncbi:MAG TPA: hypothetical protein VGK59_09240 [Ohtaekwangia sp.]